MVEVFSFQFSVGSDGNDYGNKQQLRNAKSQSRKVAKNDERQNGDDRRGNAGYDNGARNGLSFGIVPFLVAASAVVVLSCRSLRLCGFALRRCSFCRYSNS